LANAANGVDGGQIGSAASGAGCGGATSGANTISLPQETIVLTNADNWWYGPNALPPIASDIVIDGNGAVLQASHAGDPEPITANAFRFFYVSGGMELPAGSLTLHNMTVENGYAKGGDSHFGGGGAGMGGAIFNQGALTLSAVTLVGNMAHGGDT